MDFHNSTFAFYHYEETICHFKDFYLCNEGGKCGCSMKNKTRSQLPLEQDNSDNLSEGYGIICVFRHWHFKHTGPPEALSDSNGSLDSKSALITRSDSCV